MITANARWYDEAKGEVHACLAGVFVTVRDECEWRVDSDEYHAGLYCASDKPGVRGHSRRGYAYGPATLPYNLCRSAVDTLVAKMATHRPLPQVLTQKGSWKNQKRARKMTQFLEGEFYRQRFFEEHWPVILRDACIFGRGVLKVWAQADEICTERVHPWELFVDEWDGRYGKPRNTYHVRTVDRGVALELYARSEGGGWKTKARDAILTAGRFDLSEHWEDTGRMTVDRVDVLEAWHLPSGKNAKDGRHVVIVQGATLVDEPWEDDSPPFIVLSYNPAVTGTWGHGLVEQLEGYQYEINLSSEKVSQQYHMSGVGVLVPDNAGIHNQEMRNGITILNHKPGGTPSVFQMDLVNEHMRARPRELTEDGLNDAGLSQMSVQSQKPAGVTAAVALQALDDVETQRFLPFGRACETFALNAARKYIGCAKQIANDYGDLAVSVPMKGGLLDLNWNDVYVDGVEIRIFSTSLLPQQLGQRLQRLTDMWNTGMLDRPTFLRLLDAPDLQAELDLETADKLVIDEMLEVMADAEESEGEAAYMPPSAYQDMVWAGKRAQQKLNRGLLDGMPSFNQDLLRRFLKDVKVELDKLAPPPPPAMPAPPMGAPPGAQAPPPMLADVGIPGAPPMAA